MSTEQHPLSPALAPSQARLLTLPEVAAFLSVSPKTVRRLIASGELGCVRIGAQLRFERDTLFQWISARREQ